MHFSTLTLAAAIAAVLSPLVNATVYLGLRTSNDGSKSQVAYTNGTPDPCSGFTTIVNGNGNPCEHDFYVDGNNGPFRFKGCGGSGLTLFRNGDFNSNCAYKATTIGCPNGAKIAQQWACA